MLTANLHGDALDYQDQIKYLIIKSEILSDELKKAILTHSQSIIFYESYGNEDNFNNLLLPTLKNLKTLEFKTNININWKNISLQNIEFVEIYFDCQQYISNFSDFININGKTLKYLNVGGSPDDIEFLGKLFQSIAQCCINLEDLSTIYKNGLEQELMKVLDNCIKLKNIKFKSYNYQNYRDSIPYLKIHQ